MNNNDLNGYISYIFSIIYLILYGIFYFINESYTIIVNVAFIILHLIIIGLFIFFFGFVFIIALIGINFMDKKTKDYEKVKLSMKTIPFRLLIPLIYWLLPIFMYLYFITKFFIFIPFVLYPIWFPFFYKYLSKKIKNYEIKINSPLIEHHDKKMY
jgi:hypothetical protein